MSILEGFRSLDESLKERIAEIGSPLKTALAVLWLAYEKFSVEYLTVDAIVACLEAAGITYKKYVLLKALARAGNKVARKSDDDGIKYKIMIPGKKEVEDLVSGSGINVLFIQANTPRTARKQLAEYLSKFDGIIKICDPYYGARSLDVLENIPKKCQVRFLTAKTNENASTISRGIKDFVAEHPRTEIRVYSGGDLHDRYILKSDSLLIVGHGIKDIGNKDSFVIDISKSMAPDLWSNVDSAFDSKWGSSTVIY
jgi:hypothetical protein